MVIPIALCLGRFSTIVTNAQSVVLECLIRGEQRSEMLLVDPNRKSIKAGNRMIEAEVSAENIIWKEDGTIRVINRCTGAVLHRLPDDSFFQIGQCHASRKSL